MMFKSRHKRNLILVILMVGLISLLHIAFVVHYVKDEIKEYQLRIAAMNIQTLRERLNHDKNQLKILGDFLEKQEKGFWKTEESQRIVEEFQNNSNFTRIGVANIDGIMYSTKTLKAIDVSQRDYFKSALKGKISLQSIAENTDGEEIRRLNMGIPIYKSGKVDGVLIGSYSINDLHKLLPTGLSDKNIHSFIVRNDGRIIVQGMESVQYHNIEDIWLSNKRNIKDRQYQIILNSISENIGASISYYANKERHYLISVPIEFSNTYTHIEDIRWNLLVDIPAYYIVKKASHLLLENMIYVLLLLGLFVSLSVAFYKEKNKEFRMAELNSRTDTVTGGNNRRALEQIFSKISMEKHLITIFLIDLDNFKQINDKLGHLVGDEVLIQFSNILEETARHHSGFSGRLGGDEFLFCVPDIQEEHAIQLAQEIMDRFKQSFWEYNKKYNLSLTIGLAYSPKHGDGLYELIKNADDALYKGKRKGKQLITLAD